MSTVRIVLADDHTLFRQGLRRVLEEQSGWEVVAEASDGAEAVRRTLELEPHVTIMDIAMPRLNGVELVIGAFTESCPRGRAHCAVLAHRQRR